MTPKTLYDKIWDAHLVKQRADGTALIYIDRHLIHEVTSPQAFEGLRLAGRKPWRAGANLATPDHNIPTTRVERKQGISGIKDPVSKLQVAKLDQNCREFGITELGMSDRRQGIVHVVGPEQGATLPGMTIVCGDSHTSTHGALGALAHGIGTSEVEHVLATQCLLQKKMKNMLVRVDGRLGAGVTAKDVVLAIIGKIGTAGGTGYTIEYAGEVIRDLSIEGRMTVCNMSIEAGARAGLIAVDDKTLEYIEGRPFAPKGAEWERAASAWRGLGSDLDASFDKIVELRGEDIEPQVTWGTSPEMVAPVSAAVPRPESEADETRRGEIDDHRAAAHFRHEFGADDPRRGPAGNRRGGDDHIRSRDMLGEDFPLLGLFRFGQFPGIAAAALRRDLGVDEFRPKRFNLLLDRGAHIVALDDRAEPARGGDRLQTRHAGADDQHLRRPDCAGGGGEHGEELAEMPRPEQNRLVAGDARLGGERVHGLGPGNARNQLHAEGADLARGERREAIKPGMRVEEANQRRALPQQGDLRGIRWIDDQADIGLAKQRTGVGHDLGLAEKRIGEAGGLSGPSLNAHPHSLAEQPLHRIGRKRNPPLASASFLRNTNLNRHALLPKPDSRPAPAEWQGSIAASESVASRDGCHEICHSARS